MIYYKYLAILLILWRLIEFGDEYFTRKYEQTNHRIKSLIWQERINNAKEELLQLEEKIKNLNFILENLK